jgi:hypothetical protein
VSFKIHVFLENVSWVYLVKYFWAKNGVFGDLQAKTWQNRPFFLQFSSISGNFEGLFDFPLHHHPWTGHSPRQWLAHQAVLEPPMRSLALSKCRSGVSDYGRDMTQSLPLSYWSPKKSYMTSSPTATKIYIAARFRVNTTLNGSFLTVKLLISILL